MRRLLALLIALLVVAGVAFANREADPRLAAAALCTPKPSLMQRGTALASKAGSIVPALQEPLPYDKIEATSRGAWFTLGSWFGTFAAAVQGRPTTVPESDPVDCSTLLDPCLTPQGLGGNATVTPDGAIVRTAIAVGKQRGIPERGWVVILAAGFQESKIQNLNYGDRDSVGWLQQRAGWGSVSERMDPERAANKFYDALAKVNGWESMSVNDAAQRVQISGTPNAYAQWEGQARALVAKYGNTAQTNTTAAASTTPAPECVPAASGGGPGTVGTWNVWFKNSTGQINAGAGFADLVCLNEIRQNSRLRIPGYQVSPGSMAVPIIWKTSALDAVEVHRTSTLDGYARDKSAVWGIWRSKTTGKSFGAICTHQLVQGGTGWDRQAANVNRIRKSLVAKGVPVLLLGDMNAQAGKVAAAFGGTHDCVRIICLVGYGLKAAKTEVLSRFGSDHPRVRFAFPSDPGAGSAHIGGGTTPSRSMDLPGNRTAAQAVATMTGWANSGKAIYANRCLHYVAAAYGHNTTAQINGRYWAKDVFTSMPAEYKHPGDRNPPAGALVFWGIASDHPGHIALSVGGGKIASTDVPNDGRVGIRDMSYFNGYSDYLGWSLPFFPQRTQS